MGAQTKYDIIIPRPSHEEVLLAKGDVSFNPASDYWRFLTNGGAKNFDLSRLYNLCTPELGLAFRDVTAWYLRNRSTAHSFNLYTRLIHFLEATYEKTGVRISSISEEMVINYRTTLDKSTEWYLGSLRGFLKKFTKQGYRGIERHAAKLLEKITLKGNKKGWAVLTMDEEVGPFSDMEWRLIRSAVAEMVGKKSKDSLTLRQASLVYIFMAIGARSAQVSDLKIKDLKVITEKTGEISYVLKVPQVKKRHQERRGGFTDRFLDKEIGRILESWCLQAVKEHNGTIADKYELPMFPCIRRVAVAAPGFELHPDSNSIRHEIVKMFDKLSIISPRTNEKLKVIPQRFRYTLGTRAVIHGAGPGVVAKLLDHEDLQNIGIYTKFTDELIDILNEELSDDLDPIAQAFRGEIIPFDESDLSDPSKLVAYPGITPQKGYQGKCGCGGECDDVPPIFCYSCPHFSAFKEAPHEEALEKMLDERQKEIDLGNLVVAKQLNESIAACMAVIQRCKETA